MEQTERLKKRNRVTRGGVSGQREEEESREESPKLINGEVIEISMPTVTAE